MAVDAPTVEEVLTRFPSLEAQEDLVTALLPEAIAQVDERWRKADQKIAIQYLVAHMVTVEVDAGGGEGGDGVGVNTGGSNIASESFGSMSVSYGNGGAGASSSGSATWQAYGSTIYGRRYLDLLRKNFPAIVVGEIDPIPYDIPYGLYNP